MAGNIAAAHAEGITPALSWNDVGPIACDAGWEWYRHDSGLSKSWVMSVAPREEVSSNVLEALLTPTGDVDRKRVTMLQRPVSAARAMDVAEKDVTAVKNRAVSTANPDFRAVDDYAMEDLAAESQLTIRPACGAQDTAI